MGILYSHYESNNSTKINAVSGTLTKTYKDSYFVKFDKETPCERSYFGEKSFRGEWSSYYGRWEDKTPIVILQVMLCDGGYLVEAIDKEDYEKLFEEKVGD